MNYYVDYVDEFVSSFMGFDSCEMKKLMKDKTDEVDEMPVKKYKGHGRKTTTRGERRKMTFSHNSEKTKKNIHKNRGWNPHYYDKFMGWGWELVKDHRADEAARIDRKMADEPHTRVDIAWCDTTLMPQWWDIKVYMTSQQYDADYHYVESFYGTLPQAVMYCKQLEEEYCYSADVVCPADRYGYALVLIDEELRQEYIGENGVYYKDPDDDDYAITYGYDHHEYGCHKCTSRIGESFEFTLQVNRKNDRKNKR